MVNELIRRIKEQQNGKKYTILTMGCQLNENDSEKIAGMIEEIGYNMTKKIEEADLIVINTCCVRENAEERVFGKLGELKKIKEQNGTIIAIGGCMMQEEVMRNKIKKSYPFVDIIFGTHTIHRFQKDLYQAIVEKQKIQDILDINGEIHEGLPIKRKHSKQASVTIMYGCNNFCSYCIVPYVRGRERSRKPENIINEVERLAKEGYVEVTLLGQNVNSYKGRENYGFAELLRDINKIKGIERIRFVSPHPKDFTDNVIQAIKEGEHICKLIHLPLQSGSSKILKEMNRNYTKEQYIELVEKMKNQITNVTFSTDIIVGFPGETEEDFEDTLDIVKKVNFEQIYMFIYSRRSGTKADKMDNQIPEDIKHKRFELLKSLFEKKIPENNLKYVGSIQRVLVEGISKNNSKMYTGRTESNKVVNFEGKEEYVGKIVDLKIIAEHTWYLEGKLKDN